MKTLKKVNFVAKKNKSLTRLLPFHRGLKHMLAGKGHFCLYSHKKFGSRNTLISCSSLPLFPSPQSMSFSFTSSKGRQNRNKSQKING